MSHDRERQEKAGERNGAHSARFLSQPARIQTHLRGRTFGVSCKGPPPPPPRHRANHEHAHVFGPGNHLPTALDGAAEEGFQGWYLPYYPGTHRHGLGCKCGVSQGEHALSLSCTPGRRTGRGTKDEGWCRCRCRCQGCAWVSRAHNHDGPVFAAF